MVNTSENVPVKPARGAAFFKDVMKELRATTWPTRQEAWRLTVVVLAVIISMGIYVGIIDAVLSWLTNHFKLIK